MYTFPISIRAQSSAKNYQLAVEKSKQVRQECQTQAKTLRKQQNKMEAVLAKNESIQEFRRIANNAMLQVEHFRSETAAAEQKINQLQKQNAQSAARYVHTPYTSSTHHVYTPHITCHIPHTLFVHINVMCL